MLAYDFSKISLYHRFSSEFEYLAKIGNGGFSQVHKVRNMIDKHIYALKVVSMKILSSNEDMEEQLYKNLVEAKTLSTFSHPNILQYHGCWLEVTTWPEDSEQIVNSEEEAEEFEMVICHNQIDSGGFSFEKNEQEEEEDQQNEEKQPKHKLSAEKSIHSNWKRYKEVFMYILTEIGQESLQSFVYRRNSSTANTNQLSLSQQIHNYSICIDIICGLSYLHSKQIIHRDIKLQNIIITGEGHCKIIDYGLAKRVRFWHSSEEDASLSLQFDCQERVGTRIFSSPEQASNEKYDQRTDIYSLAMVIAILFSTFNTVHEERQLLYSIRSKDLTKVQMPQQLKHLIFKSLGEEKFRPSLQELKTGMKISAKQLRQSQQNQLPISSTSHLSKEKVE